MSRTLLAASLIVLATVGVPASAQPLMQPNISATQAKRIVDTIIEECSQSSDLVTVTIAVVDRAGLPVMQVRADTASPHNWELAFRKAYTARTFRRNSIDWRDRMATEAAVSGEWDKYFHSQDPFVRGAGS